MSHPPSYSASTLSCTAPNVNHDDLLVGNRTVDVRIHHQTDGPLHLTLRVPRRNKLDCSGSSRSRLSIRRPKRSSLPSASMYGVLGWLLVVVMSSTHACVSGGAGSTPSSPNPHFLHVSSASSSPLWRGLQSALSTYSRPKGLVRSTTPSWFKGQQRQQQDKSTLNVFDEELDDGNSVSSSDLECLKRIEFPVSVYPAAGRADSSTPSRLHVAQHAYLHRLGEENEYRALKDVDDDELLFLESEGQRRHHLQRPGEAGSVASCSAAALSVRHQPTSQTSSDSKGARKSRRQPPSHQRGTGSSSSSSSLIVTPASASSSSATMAASTVSHRPLLFWENMIAGAISRSIAQTIMHPANTLKTMLQTNRGVTSLELLRPQHFHRLTRGAGANFILSVPHGAVNFAVLELVRNQLSLLVEHTPALSERADSIGPGLDFVSSAISTITCSIVSTPQMVLADNIMAGNYPNLIQAVRGLAQQRGLRAFYTGWWPGLVGKIPSYALTWTFFQQLKELRDEWTGRPATDIENTIMGCIASGATVCIMIPLDTIKTRLVTQSAATHLVNGVAYKGIIDCAVRVVREEGAQALYRGLAPRLISVVPMIGIQFGVYEFMRKTMIERSSTTTPKRILPTLPRFGLDVKFGAATSKSRPLVAAKQDGPASTKITIMKKKSDSDDSSSPIYGAWEALQEAAMEVAASPEVPFPAPRFLQRIKKLQKNKTNTKIKERSS